MTFRTLQLMIAPVGLAAVTAAALREARNSKRRRRSKERPRLVYGVTPLISLKYMSEAMRRRGYATLTSVFGVAAINERSDFDETLDDLFGGRTGRLAATARALFGPYLAFGRALRRGDVFHFFFDGGFLHPTPLRFLEVQLLHLAGKKVVVMPYGGDVALPSRFHSQAWRDAFNADYPELANREEATLRRIRYFCDHADFVVGCLVHFETLPRWDLLTTHYYPVDTEAWQPVKEPEPSPTVRVFHSSNHRNVKGTDALVDACRELAQEGAEIELVLAEGIPNAEVRQLAASCQIVAEQFVLGYALAAMEGMALGKPVLSNLSEPWYYDRFRGGTGLEECPIVSTGPAELKETLRRLASDGALRDSLGKAGRRYVVEHHGYGPVATMWEHIYDAVWNGVPLPFAEWNPRRGAQAEQAAAAVGSVG
jgi:glycosyltransferase involved in cell wall biosynthesis